MRASLTAPRPYLHRASSAGLKPLAQPLVSDGTLLGTMVLPKVGLQVDEALGGVLMCGPGRESIMITLHHPSRPLPDPDLCNCKRVDVGFGLGT